MSDDKCDVDNPVVQAFIGIVKQAVDDYRMGKMSKMRDHQKMKEIQRAAESAKEFIYHPSGLELLLKVTHLHEMINLESLRRQIEVSSTQPRIVNFRNRSK